MNKIEKLNLIIKLYYEGKYDIDTFADVFSYTYGKEPNNNCDTKVLDRYKKLYVVTSRYSPYEDELLSFPNVFYDKNDVLNALEEFRILMVQNQ